MTFTVGHVHGGTGAGRKRALLPANTIPWPCGCPKPGAMSLEQPKLNPGYLARCIDCEATRDGGR